MIRGETLTASRRFELIFLFGALTVFTPIAIDMYLPALPAIAGEFHSSIAVVEHSLASYFLGVAVGQAVVGPLSDRFGRKIPLLVGLGFYVLGSAVCALSPGPLSLDAARFVQATGGCAGSVLARACVRDIFPPGQAARIFAQMLLVLSVSPLFAPLFGGWLLLIGSWRDLFWIQGALAALTAVAVFVRLPESHPGSDRAIHPVAVVRDYIVIARDRRFLGYVMASTLSGAGLYVYLTGWSHVVIDIFHVPPQYFGFTFLLNGIGLIIISQITARLLHHRPAPRLLFWALVAQAVCGALTLLFAWTGWGGLFGLLPWVFLYCSLIGAVSPTASGLALMGFGASAGMASALMGIVVYAGGTMASLAMGAFTPGTPVPMAALICLCGFAALAANHFWTAPVLEPHAPTS
ncbi:MAG TPA: multidrug effflux MFS transporter [Rhizomicrobium sp.]|jgi:DHA1 family bicyclomycin/chloramphenicol resistance-like MFS transporter|nr:multidrug effflux MFS transporter [Rhizomicrobium sp.]